MNITVSHTATSDTHNCMRAIRNNDGFTDGFILVNGSQLEASEFLDGLNHIGYDDMKHGISFVVDGKRIVVDKYGAYDKFATNIENSEMALKYPYFVRLADYALSIIRNKKTFNMDEIMKIISSN